MHVNMLTNSKIHVLQGMHNKVKYNTMDLKSDCRNISQVKPVK